MKMVRKILLGLVATAAVISFVGCGSTVGNEEEGGKKIINGSTAKAYLGEKDGDGYTNEGDSTNREMKLFATKHYDSFAALTLTGETKASYNGQLGYVFNYTENNDKTVNFITIGYRNNGEVATANKIDTYVSQFYNIKESEFDKPNFGADSKVDNRVKGTDYFIYSANEITPAILEEIKTSGKPTEIEIKKLPTQIGSLTYDNLKNDAGDLTIGIQVLANNNGSYTVNYFDEVTDAYKRKTDANAVFTVDVPATVTGYSEKKQTKIGCYVAVYGKKTLNGFWRFSEISGEDIPLEEFAD